MTGIDATIKDKIIALISALLPDTKIYLFGSRAQRKDYMENNMKKIMALLALCILSSACAMNNKDPYLSSQYWLWESIDEPSVQKNRPKSHSGWEEELTADPSMGYASTNACIFNATLHDKLGIILHKQIAELFSDGAQWSDIAPLVLQEAANIDVLLACAHHYRNSIIFCALLRKLPALSVFTWAIAEQNIEALRIAVERGIDINRSINDTKETALMHWSVGSYSARHILALLALGANPNAQNKKGKTPLMYAVENLQRKATTLLLAHGANPYVHDNKGRHVLSYAGTEKKLTRLIVKGLKQYKCLACPDCTNKTLTCEECENKQLTLLPCINKHLSNFICPQCLATIKTQDNACPLCSNQLS